MTTISAKIIADSIGAESRRITTMQLRYPRWIHAEERTHRQLSTGEEWPTPSIMADPNLSRNASSSRAIPVERLIADIESDPAVPMFWGKNQKGMQAGEEHDALLYSECVSPFDMLEAKFEGVSREAAWLKAKDQAVKFAKAFHEAGYHKQIVNRLLEPFSHINVVVTATEWSNFFALRRHPDAEPHIHLLADRMFEAMENSKPTYVKRGAWHLPYVADNDREIWDYGIAHDLDLQEVALKCSVARCARVSYLTHEGKKPNVADDVQLYDRLIGGSVLHASPTEHQASPDWIYEDDWNSPNDHGNFVGWKQYRKTLPGECL